MIFSKKLQDWYQYHKRDLPWRTTKNPYHVWLSEVILQQTRVVQGLDYYLKFITNFPTIQSLANADEETVLKLWQGLGYYSRARNLHFAAKTVVAKFEGNFPKTFDEIITLKGVGDYTAAAIASFCFDEPKAVVDGNVYRVLARYFGIEIPINSTEGIKKFKELAQQVLDYQNPATHNQAIMEFGALQCKPVNPFCESCIFNDSCWALQHQKVADLPVKLNKIKVKKRYFNFLVIKTDDENTILHQRTSKDIWQGLYQFPLIEGEKNFTISEVKIHPNFSELALQSASISLFNQKPIVHKLSHQTIFTNFYIVEVRQHKDAIVAWSNIQNYPVPVLIVNFLNEFLVNQSNQF